MLSPSICSSQFSRLRFLLQIQVHGFLFINFFFYFFLPSLFFPKISLSRYEKFSVFTFRPSWNGTIFKTLVHTVSAPCRRGEKKKRKEKTPLGHIDLCSEEAFFFIYFFRTSTSVLRKKMSVGLWVWWVLIEESVGMVSLNALLLVCRGSDHWGSW